MTYYMDSFGCVKNQVDAENMMAFLNRAGWAAAENVEAADLIIVNSCGFIESAKQESINAVLTWRKLCPDKKILLAGCLAQRYAKELAEELPEADGLFGINDLAGIAEAACGIVGMEAAASPDAGADAVPAAGSRPLLSLPGSAYVKISEGCDNKCSFCAIPLIRGGQRSRSVEDITSECKTLLGRGVKELCLIGQDTGSYGRNLIAGGSLPALMEALRRIEGKFWVRILYIHPDHFPMPILDIMEEDNRFLPYFDIPFQHGSEKILRAMNRKGNAGDYLGLIENIRRRFRDAIIRSTFLTGFPGETEEDFELLLDFQKKARLDWLGCFAYSREENTPAWGMKGRVAKKTATERKRLVEETQVPITEKQMDRFIGRQFDVLAEVKFENANNGVFEESTLYLGRLPFQAPEVDGSAVILSNKPLELGVMIPCRVYARRNFDLEVRTD
jgi:ribosomal protein S12 methylthiotransferase